MAKLFHISIANYMKDHVYLISFSRHLLYQLYYQNMWCINFLPHFISRFAVVVGPKIVTLLCKIVRCKNGIERKCKKGSFLQIIVNKASLSRNEHHLLLFRKSLWKRIIHNYIFVDLTKKSTKWFLFMNVALENHN